MILSLVSQQDPILRQVAEPFDFKNPSTDPIELSRNLAETMISNRGLGIAANQVGLLYRCFALLTNPILVMFNPRIVDMSNDTQIDLEEGCLTYPNLFVKIKRPRVIKVRYTLPNNETKTERFDGITSRCIQHELDHLNGIVFLSHVHRVHLERAYRTKKKLDRQKKNLKQMDLVPITSIESGTQSGAELK